MAKQNKNIKIECKYDELIELDKLLSIQESLKIKHDIPKLKTSIVNNGVKFPIFVWKDPADNSVKIVNGVHRIIACKELQVDGYSIEKYPVIFVECSSHAEAKELILYGGTSYTKITKDRFRNFVDETTLDMMDLNEELSSRDYKFLKDLLIEPDFVEDAKIKGTGGGSSQRTQVNAGDIDFVIFQIIFKNKVETEKFWKLMSKLRNSKYKSDDYKDILFKVITTEAAKVSDLNKSEKKKSKKK